MALVGNLRLWTAQELVSSVLLCNHKSIQDETVRKVCENFQYLDIGIFVHILSGSDDMRTRKKSLVDFGVYPEDINRLKDICQKATPEQRHDILHCCISSCPPGIELLVYESIVTNKSYDRIMKTKYIPAKRDDFYAYKRKAMAMFYDTLRKLREI